MKIVLAIDGSKFSEAAVEAVIDQMRVPETEIHVLHVVEKPSLLVAREMGGSDRALDVVWEAETKEAWALVQKVAERLRSVGLKVTTAVEEGDPKSNIVDAASKWRADLIVVGSHGHKGLERFLIGSVPDAVARHAGCSVEIVRIPLKLSRILLAIDDSKFSWAAVEAVMAQLQPQGREIKVLNVADPFMPVLLQDSVKRGWELVQRAEEKLRDAGYQTQTAVEEGDPKSTILDQATRWDSGLIAMGSHGRTGLGRFLMGSVAQGVAHHALCSVEIVRLPKS
jgi:nucleotide-binding universal stress UspA family protein